MQILKIVSVRSYSDLTRSQIPINSLDDALEYISQISGTNPTKSLSHFPPNGSSCILDQSGALNNQVIAMGQKVVETIEALRSPDLTQESFDELKSKLNDLITQFFDLAIMYAFLHVYKGPSTKAVFDQIRSEENFFGDSPKPTTIFKKVLLKGKDQLKNAILKRKRKSLSEGIHCTPQIHTLLKGLSQDETTKIRQKYQVILETFRKLSHQLSDVLITESLRTHPNLKQNRFSFAHTLNLIRSHQNTLALTPRDISEMMRQVIVSTKHPCESLHPQFLNAISLITTMFFDNLQYLITNRHAIEALFKLDHLEIRKPKGEAQDSHLKDVQDRITNWDSNETRGTTLCQKHFSEAQETKHSLNLTNEASPRKAEIGIKRSNWALDSDGDYLVQNEYLLHITRNQIAQGAENYRKSRELEIINTTIFQLLNDLRKEMTDLQLPYPEIFGSKMIFACQMNRTAVHISATLATTNATNGKDGYTHSDRFLEDIDELLKNAKQLASLSDAYKPASELILQFRETVRMDGFGTCSGQHRQEGKIFLTILKEMLGPYMDECDGPQLLTLFIDIYKALKSENAQMPQPLQSLLESANPQNIFEYALKNHPFFKDAPSLTSENYTHHIQQIDQAICRQETEFLNSILTIIDHTAIGTIIISQVETASQIMAAQILFHLADLENATVGPLGENRQALLNLPTEVEKIEEKLQPLKEILPELERSLTECLSTTTQLDSRARSLKLYLTVTEWFDKHQSVLEFLYQAGYSDNGKLVGAVGAKEGLNACIKRLYEILNKRILDTVLEVAEKELYETDLRKIEVLCSRLQVFLGGGTSPGRSGGIVNFGGIREDFALLITHILGKYLHNLMWTAQGNGKTFNQLHPKIWGMVLEQVLSAQSQSMIEYLLNGETASPILDSLGNDQKDIIEDFIFGTFLHTEYDFPNDEAQLKKHFLVFFDLFLNNQTLKRAKASLRPSSRQKPEDADDNRAIGTQVAQLATSFNYTLILLDFKSIFTDFDGPKGVAKQLEQDEHFRLTFASMYYQYKSVDWEYLTYHYQSLMNDPLISDEDTFIISAYFVKIIESYDRLKNQIDRIPNVTNYLDRSNLERIEHAKQHCLPWRIKLTNLGIRLRAENNISGDRKEERAKIIDEIYKTKGAIQAILGISG
ncbi:MAG: hypothetical protein HRT90_01325 [Candidatus Margulisbacteria bacterium]|nr:hypothetical protein [Candidatus Margulisiibacteriota bacterium]